MNTERAEQRGHYRGLMKALSGHSEKQTRLSVAWLYYRIIWMNRLGCARAAMNGLLPAYQYRSK